MHFVNLRRRPFSSNCLSSSFIFFIVESKSRFRLVEISVILLIGSSRGSVWWDVPVRIVESGNFVLLNRLFPSDCFDLFELGLLFLAVLFAVDCAVLESCFTSPSGVSLVVVLPFGSRFTICSWLRYFASPAPDRATPASCCNLPPSDSDQDFLKSLLALGCSLSKHWFALCLLPPQW